MNNLPVSIIVPVYNVANYLIECVDSILGQTFSDFELILVNDGSTDKSLDICRKYEAKDSRIRVVDKQNGGVSSARNAGIDRAKGEYITFVDSDDLIKIDYLENLVNALNIDTDLVQSGIIFFDNASGREIGQEELPVHNKLFRNAPGDCLLIATMPLITSPVSKLYRTSILRENDIRFDESFSYGEDRDFNLKYLGVVQSVRSIGYKGYLYRKGLDNSLSCDKDYLKLLDLDLAYWNRLKNFFRLNNCPAVECSDYLANRLYNFYNDRFIQYAKSLRPPFFVLTREILKFIGRPEYRWFQENGDSIRANAITKAIYKSGCAGLIGVYLKLV